ncbi:MAG TPA: tetratricopeptide repeat protein [Rhizobiales bacterium]|nr:tetratricopeptide repeat protein [Hyphomicrobiales bacterium]
MSEELLFREVDEEVRRDEIENIWKKYGSWILALCLGIVLAVGGLKGWQYWQKQQAEAGGAAYFEAVKLANDGKTAEAEKAFAKLAENHAGYGIFGRFKEAALLLKDKKTKDAVAVYDAIAADNSVPAFLQELSLMKAAYALADTATVAEIEARVSRFDNATSPWRSSARELIALAAFRGHDYALADRKLNEILADLQATAGAKQRARIFLSVLAPKLADKKTKSN